MKKGAKSPAGRKKALPPTVTNDNSISDSGESSAANSPAAPVTGRKGKASLANSRAGKGKNKKGRPAAANAQEYADTEPEPDANEIESPASQKGI